MRRLFLLRHAKSSREDAALDDFERPLNDRGRRGARAMAEFLHDLGIRPALVLCSAARRTRQTWDLLEPRLPGVPVSIETGLYEAARPHLAERLRRLDDHLSGVMLIGHNPGLERLAEFLTQGAGEAGAVAALSAKFPTAALAVLETEVARWAALDKGTCRLARFVRPADLD